MSEYIPNSMCKSGTVGSTISIYSTQIESNEVAMSDVADSRRIGKTSRGCLDSRSKMSQPEFDISKISQKDLSNVVFNYNYDNKTNGVMQRVSSMINYLDPVKEPNSISGKESAPIKIYEDNDKPSTVLISGVIDQLTSNRTQSMESLEPNLEAEKHKMGNTFNEKSAKISALSFTDEQLRENWKLKNKLRLQRNLVMNSGVKNL